MSSNTATTFWDHLDELRSVLIRIAVVVVVAGGVAFSFKDQLFSIVFAARNSDFITYRVFDKISVLINQLLSGEASSVAVQNIGVENFSIELINTQLTQQFTTHISIAMWAGVLVVFPYILFEIFRFISPALYSNERRYTSWVVGCGYIMFILGVALSYFLIFPLTFRFLATYQVSSSVANMIAMESYIGTLITLSLMMGVVFEMPILCWLFAKLGFLTADFMRRYRRYAIVILLLISAIITPTADIVTMLLVAMPMYMLYELSILIVALARR
ncbi:MAG: twin-arginine translocase subunit TatC [Rikenellaceae bacterium]